ncbi:MAG TPA: response regulator [Gemmata sp.]
MSAHTDRVLSVLIVEDRPEVADSTAELLDLCGHNCRVARTGAEALAALVLQLPDVVLLDLGLPDMDGRAVALEFRSRCRAPQPVLIAVTGRGSESDRRASADAGIDLHLVKPVEPSVLMSLLTHIRHILIGRPSGSEVPE